MTTMTEDSFKNGWPVPQIDSRKCDGCNLCVLVCPNHVLTLQNQIALVAYPEKCDYTGLCEQICPQKAIQLVFEIFIFDNDEKKLKRSHE